MFIHSQFEPVWWLKNAHAQTLYPSLTNRLKATIDHYERLELPDGDFIDLAWAVNNFSDNSPLVVLLHGLGGDVNSVYIAGLLNAFNNQGYRGVVMHFRGAGLEPNRLPRAYHSGDTEDLAYFLEILTRREPESPKAVVGISLGGNILLKWLGETGAQSLVKTAVAVSVPFQLQTIAEQIGKGFSRIYEAYLLRAMRSLFLRKLNTIKKRLPISEKDLYELKTLKEFDDRITAPLHGFKNAEIYYQKSSSRQFLGKIDTETLIIHALDDPFMIPQIIPQEKELSSKVTLELSRHGGHVGFIAAANDNATRPVYWLEQRIPEFLKQYLEVPIINFKKGNSTTSL